jgi:hypothetical protein
MGPEFFIDNFKFDQRSQKFICFVVVRAPRRNNAVAAETLAACRAALTTYKLR